MSALKQSAKRLARRGMGAKRAVAWMLLALTLMWAHPSLAEERIVLNFRNANIRSVVEAVGKLTGKTFIIDPGVKGTVTIISSDEVPLDLVYDILLTALKLQGVSAFPTGDATTIAPADKAKLQSSAILGKDQKPAGGEYVTKVYPLRFTTPDQVAPLLKPLMGASSVLSGFPSDNMLVISDYADNIARLSQLVETFDQPKRGEVESIPLTHVSAAEFVKVFNELYPYALEKGTTLGGSFALSPDARTNSLLMRSDNKALSAQVRELVKMMDVPASQAGGIRVVRLRYADAKKVAEILNGIQLGEGGQDKDRTLTLSPAAPPGGPGGAGEAKAAAKPSGAAVKAGIQVDEASNSLVISGPDYVYNLYRNLIEQLDKPRKQVYVEALITEVASTKLADFGIQWQSLRGFDPSRAPSVTGVGGVNVGGSSIGGVTGSTKGGMPTFGPGLNVGIMNGVITLADGTVIPNLMALAHALETTSDANILSTPTLLTLDNEEATIHVGQNIAIPTGSYAQTGQGTGTAAGVGAVNPFTTFDRKDIGLEIKVKPRISGESMVLLDIYQEISDVISLATPNGPTYTKRDMKSTVLVEDGKTVVLGGLIQDSYKNSKDKVPLLGDLPLVGALFRYEQRKREKTNLMVFLVPHIIPAPEDVKPYLSKNFEGMRQKQREYKEYYNPLLPDYGQPVLPELSELEKVPALTPAEAPKPVEEEQAAPKEEAKPAPKPEVKEEPKPEPKKEAKPAEKPKPVPAPAIKAAPAPPVVKTVPAAKPAPAPREPDPAPGLAELETITFHPGSAQVTGNERKRLLSSVVMQPPEARLIVIGNSCPDEKEGDAQGLAEDRAAAVADIFRGAGYKNIEERASLGCAPHPSGKSRRAGVYVSTTPVPQPPPTLPTPAPVKEKEGIPPAKSAPPIKAPPVWRGPASRALSGAPLATVTFHYGSSSITDEERERLLSGAEGMTRGAPLEVVGAACPVVNDAAAREVARRRAEAVAKVYTEAGYVNVTPRGVIDCAPNGQGRIRRVEVYAANLPGEGIGNADAPRERFARGAPPSSPDKNISESVLSSEVKKDKTPDMARAARKSAGDAIRLASAGAPKERARAGPRQAPRGPPELHNKAGPPGARVGTVTFRYLSARVTDEERGRLLDAVAAVDRDTALEVVGNACPVSDERGALIVATSRAEAVARVFRAAGFGNARAVASVDCAPDESGRVRRAVVWLGGDARDDRLADGEGVRRIAHDPRGYSVTAVRDSRVVIPFDYLSARLTEEARETLLARAAGVSKRAVLHVTGNSCAVRNESMAREVAASRAHAAASALREAGYARIEERVTLNCFAYRGGGLRWAQIRLAGGLFAREAVP